MVSLHRLLASLESVHTARKLHIWTTLKTLPHWSNKLFPQHFYDHDVALEKILIQTYLLVLWQKRKKTYIPAYHLWVLVWKTWTMFTLMECFLVSHRPYRSCDTREKKIIKPGKHPGPLQKHAGTTWPHWLASSLCKYHSTAQQSLIFPAYAS